MGLLDRFMGRDEPEPPRRDGARSEDDVALERYRYLVRTAPPERIEQAHEEAFAKLTPEQRRLALEQLVRDAPEHEDTGGSDDPRSLARMATRAEMREPGAVERAFGGARGGFGGGLGGGMAVPLLGTFATAFAGTLAAQALFADLADGELIDSFGDGEPGGDLAGGEGGGDVGGGDLGFGDLGVGDLGI